MAVYYVTMQARGKKITRRVPGHLKSVAKTLMRGGTTHRRSAKRNACGVNTKLPDNLKQIIADTKPSDNAIELLREFYAVPFEEGRFLKTAQSNTRSVRKTFIQVLDLVRLEGSSQVTEAQEKALDALERRHDGGCVSAEILISLKRVSKDPDSRAAVTLAKLVAREPYNHERFVAAAKACEISVQKKLLEILRWAEIDVFSPGTPQSTDLRDIEDMVFGVDDVDRGGYIDGVGPGDANV